MAGSGFDVVPEQVREVGQAVVRLSQDVGSIVSAGAATIKLAGSGNAGFLATPAMAALTAAHLAALTTLGNQLERALAAGKLVTTFGPGGGEPAAVLQAVADVATGQSPVDGPRTAEVIAARVAARPELGTLGPVDRREIDEVLGPAGVIGAAGLADWLARRSTPGPPAE